MDEIDYNNKLGTNNPTTIALTLSKLCNTIERKILDITEKEGSSTNLNNSLHDIAELKYLKLKCSVNNKLIALTAAQGISYLVEKNVLQLRPTVAEFVSIIPHSRCFSGIITAICNLLAIEVKRVRYSSTKSNDNYKLLSPQHPLITILLHDYNTWLEIFQKLKEHFLQMDESLSETNYELFRIIFFFVMCNPDPKIPVLCRSEIWNFLVHLNDKYSRDIVLDEILPWLPIHSTFCSFQVCNIIALVEFAIENHDNELLYSLSYLMGNCLYYLNKLNEDPRDCIEGLLEIIDVLEDDFPYTFLLLTLTEVLYIVPSIYLMDLLKLCKTIITTNPSNTFSLLPLKASLLQWLMFSCTLTQDCKESILDILSTSNGVLELKSNSKFRIHSHLRYSDKHINLTLNLCDLIGYWKGNKEVILKWVRSLLSTPSYFLANIFNFLSGIFIWKNAPHEIINETLKILIKAISFDSNLSYQMLTLVLYKLSNEKESEMQLILLNSLPKLTILPQNIPLIIKTIHTLSNGPEILRVHSMRLLADIWTIEPKCYTHLQKILLRKPEPLQAMEFYVLKAYILQNICYKRPEVYGTEMVSHLSDILNRCSGNSGTLASTLALKGIMHLCKASIIDVASTWHALAPKFKVDCREGVIISLCNFFAEIPNCYVTPEKTDILDRDIIDKLWDLLATSTETNVLLSAAEALGKFANEKVKEQALERYLDEDGKFSESSWLKVVEYSTVNYEASGNLLISLIRNEIREFRGGVYLIPEGRREPSDYNYLPQNSVLRAVGNYVVRQVSVAAERLKDPTRNPVFIQCLRILSEIYSKPLPPLDWCFLQEFLHVPAIRCYILKIAAHQILLSGTARRLIDNFIIELKPGKESIDDVLIIFSSLKYLCNGIQPSTLQPFIKASLNFVIMEEIKYQIEMLQCIKEAVMDKEVHLANKSGIAEILKLFLEDVDIQSMLFPYVLECVVELDDEFTFLINGSADKHEGTNKSDNFEKYTKICAKLVENCSNFKYFNPCIGFASNESERKCVEIHLVDLVKKENHLAAVHSWISELLTKIQASIAEENNPIAKLSFLCDLYIISINILSGVQCIFPSDALKFEEHLDIFPLAIGAVLKIPEFHSQASQIIEWLHFMVHFKQMAINYRIVFYKCLMALKYENKFQEKWTKYAVSECPINY